MKSTQRGHGVTVRLWQVLPVLLACWAACCACGKSSDGNSLTALKVPFGEVTEILIEDGLRILRVCGCGDCHKLVSGMSPEQKAKIDFVSYRGFLEEAIDFQRATGLENDLYAESDYRWKDVFGTQICPRLGTIRRGYLEVDE